MIFYLVFILTQRDRLSDLLTKDTFIYLVIFTRVHQVLYNAMSKQSQLGKLNIHG